MDLADLLWSHTWWQLESNCSWSERLWQHWFNLFEGVCWCVFAGLVVQRARRHAHSKWLKIAYAVAFLTFGVSDFEQAFRLTSWLLIWKFANLVALLWLRHRTMKTLYPNAKVF